MVDLDAEPDSADDIERYVASRLRVAGRPDLQARVAPVLAARAAADHSRGGFLYARIVTSQVVRQVVDVQAQGWEQRLATSLATALDLDLTAGPIQRRDDVELPGAARDLLRALARALGRGMPGRGVWEATATALSPEGVQYQAADLDWVLEQYGRYIVEDGQAVYRLYHREFVEHLIGSSPPVGDRSAELALAEALVTLTEEQTDGCTEPLRANPYLQHHLARHASLAGAPGIAALRRLAEANPDAYLPNLATSLNNLANNLAELDRANDALEVYTTYVDAFAASPDTRAVLVVERARFQLRHGDASTGLHDIIALLTSNVPVPTGSVAVSARRTLRAHLTQDAASVHRTWRALTGTEPPGWLTLTDEQLNTVTDWITTPTWTDSKAFLVTHIEELLAPPAAVALDELHLLDPALADQHRQLLDLVREHGVDSAYLPLVLRDLLIAWIGTESWADSQAFATEHATELLTVEASTVLAQLGDDATIAVHLALLGLAQRDGIEAAYGCVTDRQLAADRMQRALVELEPDTIVQLAVLEGHVFGEQFAAVAHFAIASSLNGTVPDSTDKLAELAEQADVADRQRVTAEVAELIGRSPEHATQLSALLQLLLRPAPG